MAVEQLGITSLLERLGIPLNITFDDRLDRPTTSVSFTANWGFCHYSRSITGEIALEHHDLQCGVEIAPSERQMRVWGKDVNPLDRSLWHGLIRYGISAYISDCGYTPIHAAAVVAPNNHAWLIAGQTHSGKSTLVLGLLAAGWQFLSDDSLILAAADDRIFAHAWLGTSLLDPILLLTYPHLQSYLGTAVGDRRLIDLHSCYPTQWIATTQPQGLLFPMFSPNTDIAMLESISPGMALGNLMSHTAPWLMETPQAHLPRLQQLIARSQYFNLLLGSTLQTQPQLVADILVAMAN